LERANTVYIRNVLIGIASILAACSMPAFSQGAHPAAARKPAPRVKIAHPEIPRIPAKELVQLLKSKADVVIVDTQAADGYEMWHIPSAVNIPYVSTANPTGRELMLLALPMDKQIVLYCLCEEGTDSAKMALELRRLGYRDDQVRVLEGGLVLWDEKGYPMVKQKILE
jgi:rhodanese-related sulfurtransferase